MTNTSQHQPDDDGDEAEAWLARLRASRSAKPTPDNEEDRAMVQAIIQHHKNQEAELLKDAQSSDQAWQQMRFRLKREGLLQYGNRWKTWVPMAMAAAVLAAVVLPALLGPSIDVLDTEPTTLRGGGLSFQASDPLKQAKAVAKDLKPLDPSLKLHWFGGVATIDVDLEAAELDQAEGVVRQQVSGREVRLNIGFNRLEFSAVK